MHVIRYLVNFQERILDMKKVSLLTAVALAATVSTASADMLMGGCPKPFQGFQLRGILGYGVGTVKTGDGLGRAKLGVNGVEGGIGTGYNFGCGNWRFGVLFDAIWADTKGGNISRAKMKNSLELYGKVGYVVCQKVMPFLGLGWSNSKWSAFNGGGNSSSKRFDSLLWKAGVDFHMTKHLIAGVEYTGFAGDSKTENGIRVKPHDNRFAGTLTLIY